MFYHYLREKFIKDDYRSFHRIDFGDFCFSVQAGKWYKSKPARRLVVLSGYEEWEVAIIDPETNELRDPAGFEALPSPVREALMEVYGKGEIVCGYLPTSEVQRLFEVMCESAGKPRGGQTKMGREGGALGVRLGLRGQRG